MLLKLFSINICVFFSNCLNQYLHVFFSIFLKPISAHCLHLVWNLKLLPKFARRHGSHHLTHPHLQKLSLSAFLIFLVLQSFVFHIIHSESKESKDSLSHLSPFCVLFAFDRGPIFLLLNLGKTLVGTTTTITIINNKVLLKIRKRALICSARLTSNLVCHWGLIVMAIMRRNKMMLMSMMVILTWWSIMTKSHLPAIFVIEDPNGSV